MLDWVEGVQSKGGGDAMMFHAVGAKKKSDYTEPMGFESVVNALTDTFTKKSRAGPRSCRTGTCISAATPSVMSLCCGYGLSFRSLRARHSDTIH